LSHSTISKILTNTGIVRESTLTLLVTRILANDAHDALAPYDFAIAADALHGRLNFHVLLLVCESLEAAVIPGPAVDA